MVLLTDGSLLVSKGVAPDLVKQAGWDDGIYIAPSVDEKEVFFVAIKKL